MADHTHPRPEQAEEPVDDVGASNVDLDEARHAPDHVSPAVPEAGHAPVGHDDSDPDAHGGHPVEDPKWVLAPLAVGAVVGLVLVIILGLQAGATP